MHRYLTIPQNWKDHQQSNPDFQKAFLVNALLLLMMAVLGITSILDSTLFDLREVAIVNSIGFLLSVAAFIHFRLVRNIRVSSSVTVLLFTLFVTVTILMQAPMYHIVVWMCTIPPVAFFLLGIKGGYRLTIPFGIFMELYFILKGYLTEGPEHLVNITLAYACIMVFVALFERTRRFAFRQLLLDIERRKNIEKQIQLLNAQLEEKVLKRTRQLEELNRKLSEEILIRKNAEEKSLQSMKEAVEANKVKSEFLSRMSHKLRTPLNSILGFSQVLEMSRLDDRQKKNLQHISSGGHELLRLVNDILEINTIDNLEVNVSAARFSLNELIRAAIRSHGRNIFQKNLQIKIIEDPAGDIFIRSDRKLLEKLINYLLDNAVKFNRTDGEIKIQVKESVDPDHSGGVFQLSFFDTGIGILEKDQAKIFDMFLTGDTGSYDAENIGLGLTMAKKIVEKLGGTIGVESRHGEGSHFWFRVPVSLDHEPGRQKVNDLAASGLSQRESHPVHHPAAVATGDDR